MSGCRRPSAARVARFLGVTDLWFDRDLGRLGRRGGMLYVSRPGELWALHRRILAIPGVPDDLAQQARELLGDYGAFVGGAGFLLLFDDVTLPPELEKWSSHRDRPAAELGGWEPTLITIDDREVLALRRDFDEVRAFATTFGGEHLSVLAPASEGVVRLVHRDDLDAPPFGWDQFGP